MMDARSRRGFIVDTFAQVIFFQPLMAIYEYARGMSFSTIVSQRLEGIIIGLLVGGINGRYRNWWYRRFGFSAKTSKWRRIAGESFVNFTFQTPIYTFILLINGHSWSSIPGLALPGVALATIASFPYGMFQDRMRKWFGVPTAVEQAKSK